MMELDRLPACLFWKRTELLIPVDGVTGMVTII